MISSDHVEKTPHFYI
uniref:Uncharacterized protein n=1 Tax=Arundo donax TaxID=35708 RepID=A0A0A9FF06_ARUDO